MNSTNEILNQIEERAQIALALSCEQPVIATCIPVSLHGIPRLCAAVRYLSEEIALTPTGITELNNILTGNEGGDSSLAPNAKSAAASMSDQDQTTSTQAYAKSTGASNPAPESPNPSGEPESKVCLDCHGVHSPGDPCFFLAIENPLKEGWSNSPIHDEIAKFEARINLDDVESPEDFKFIIDALTKERDKADALLKRAWRVIKEGDWKLESQEWRKCAAAWRDDYFYFASSIEKHPGRTLPTVPATGNPITQAEIDDPVQCTCPDWTSFGHAPGCPYLEELSSNQKPLDPSKVGFGVAYGEPKGTLQEAILRLERGIKINDKMGLALQSTIDRETAALREELAKVRAERDEAKNDQRFLERQIIRLKAENERITSKLSALEQAHSEGNISRLTEARINAEDETAQLREQLDQAKNCLDSISVALNLSGTTSEIVSAVSKLASEAITLNRFLAKQGWLESPSTRPVGRIIWRVEQLQAEKDALEKQLDEARQQAETWKITADSHCVVLNDKDADIAALETSIARKDAVLETCKTTFEMKCEGQHKWPKEDIVSALTLTPQTCRDRIAELEKELESVRAIGNETQIQLRQAQAQVTKMKTLSEKVNLAQYDRIRELEERVTAITKERDEVQARSHDVIQASRLAQYATEELGWNGVTNSKLLSVFVSDYIQQLRSEAAELRRHKEWLDANPWVLKLERIDSKIDAMKGGGE